MAKFKAGDRVRCINANHWPHLKVGQVYTIHHYGKGDYRDAIQLTELLTAWPSHWRYDRHFELAEEVKAPDLRDLLDSAVFVRTCFLPAFGAPFGSYPSERATPKPNPMAHTGEGDLKAGSQGDLFPYIIEKVGDKWYWINHVEGRRSLAYSYQGQAVASARNFKEYREQVSTTSLTFQKQRYAEHMRDTGQVSRTTRVAELPPTVQAAKVYEVEAVPLKNCAASPFTVTSTNSALLRKLRTTLAAQHGEFYILSDIKEQA